MANPSQPIVIEAPRQGISLSPHVGFADVRNLDIFSIPGVVRLNTEPVKKTGTTVDATVNWIVRDPDTSANIFALDSNGVLYKSADSGATWAEVSDRLGVGQGLAVQWGYVFVFCVTTIDVMKISDSSWTTGWQTIGTDSLWHPAFVSKNDSKIYFGCGRYLGSIEQNTGQTFDPASAATYTVTLGTSASNALDLPASYRIKCIEELGNNLMLGTWQGTNVYDVRIADIFPWDRSAVSFGQPIVIDDFGVHAMKNIGNILYVLAGISGTVRRSDGVNTYIVGQIPTDLSGGKYIEFYPGAACHYKNRFFFGTGNGGTTAVGGQGVYSLQLTGRGNILTLESLPSTLTDGSAASVKINALLPVTLDTLLIGWQNSTSYGIDLTSSTSYAWDTDYSGYFDSPLYSVGNDLSPRTFTQIDLQLAKELATGEGIKIEYRINLTDSWTTYTTVTYASFGAISSYHYEQKFPPCEKLQIRCSLLGSATTTPQLRSLTIR